MSDDVMKLRLLRCASAPGDGLEGQVSLHFPVILQANIREVYVKLCGSLTVYVWALAIYARVVLTFDIYRTIEYNSRSSMVPAKSTTAHKLVLTRDKLSVWRRGSYPPADTHTLQVPFHFELSKQLPYTCRYSLNQADATITSEISYHVELVGVRPAWRSKRRQRTAFRVVPSLVQGMAIQHHLAMTWPGQWRTVSRERRIPLGTTGGYSHVQFSVSPHCHCDLFPPMS